MDLIKVTEMIYKTTSIVMLFLIVTSCFQEGTSTFEGIVEDICTQDNKTYKVLLKENIQLDFEKLYIIEGPRFPAEIQEIVKVEYKDLLDDGDRLYLFIKGTNIVKQEKSSSKDINVHRLMNQQGFALLYSEKELLAKKRKNGEKFYYDVFYK